MSAKSDTENKAAVPSLRCVGCSELITDKRLLTCYECLNKYDILCVNVPSKIFDAMDAETKSIWICPECFCKKPKTDNINTPLRNTTPRLSESLSPSQGASNVTLRNKNHQRKLVSDTEVFGFDVPQDKLRAIIREELRSILKETIKEQIVTHLKCIDDKMTSFTNSVNNIKNEISVLKDEIMLLKDHINQQEQSTLSNEIELQGIPETKTENLHHLVLVTAQTVGVALQDNDIDWVSRVGPKTSYSTSYTGTRFPRPVVIRLVRRAKRDELLRAGGIWSLRNVTISVPRGVLSGEGAVVTMRCQYDLEGAALYSIRWYRADTEFYRFVPREMPPSLVFPLPGASVDLSASDHESVRVVGLHRRLSGIFSCEVSADAPLFHTDIRAAPLTIVDPPFRAPRLYVPRVTYVRGGVLRANCSVDAAFPAANLTWTVDGLKIAEHVSPPPISELDFSERGASSVLELTVFEAEHYRVGLSHTSGVINHQYSDHYVYDNKEKDPEPEALRYALVAPTSGQFQLRCVATIFNVYARAGEPITLREDTPHPASVTGEDSAGSGQLADAMLTILVALSPFLLILML